MITPVCPNCGNENPEYEESDNSQTRFASEGFQCHECDTPIVVEYDIKYIKGKFGLTPFYTVSKIEQCKFEVPVEAWSTETETEGWES